MANANKWSYRDKKYEDYTLPEGATKGMNIKDMDTIITCAECGAKIALGNGLTSRSIHDDIGIGFIICETCARNERTLSQKFGRVQTKERKND